MREILFRGKDAESGKWLYGWVFGEKTKSIIEIGTKYVSEHGVDAYYTSVVIPETVGQSTGLKDRNGVEIYEGDIVTDERGNHAYIAFLRQEMGYVLVFERHDSRLGHRNRGSGYDSDLSLEVIGNITDNPELVGKKK